MVRVSEGEIRELGPLIENAVMGVQYVAHEVVTLQDSLSTEVQVGNGGASELWRIRGCPIELHL